MSGVDCEPLTLASDDVAPCDGTHGRTSWSCRVCLALLADAPADHEAHSWSCECGLAARTPRRASCVAVRYLSTREVMSARLAVRQRRRVAASLSPFTVRFDALATVRATDAHYRRTVMRSR